MGQTTILDRHQKEFLELVLASPYLLKNYYWTGGTVLAEFYLHHRESYDIDLFTENEEVHLPSIIQFIHSVKRKLKAKNITHRNFLGLHTFIFQFSDSELKIDFNYYPFPRINLGQKWQGLAIDSLEDIAVNKVHTISMKPRERDFVDLYFIFKQTDFTLPRLIGLAKAKFDWPIDSLQLGQSLTQVVGYQDLPKLLIPFNKADMDKFFLKLAKDLQPEIFK